MDVQKITDEIIEILVEKEETLSDGFCYYGGDEAVNIIRDEIYKLLNNYNEKR